MASRQENIQSSYDVTRFICEVKEDLLCLICKEVPKDPRLCKNKDHVFCLPHISKYLENSQTCPYCRDPLTPETLRRPTGFLKKSLDEMKIKCDHHDRGCPDVVRLEYLPKHVDQCEFAPVKCGNEGCGMVVNKRDKECHEKNLCEFRMKASQDGKTVGLNKTQDNIPRLDRKLDEIKDRKTVESNTMKDEITEIGRKLDESKDRKTVESNTMKDEITEIGRKLDESKDGKTVESNKMKDKMTGLEGKLDESKIMTAIERIHDIMQLSTDEVDQQLQTVMKILNQVLQQRNVNSNDPEATDPQISANNHDIIIIIGGLYVLSTDRQPITVEKFNIVEGISTELPGMHKPRAASTAGVYNGDVIVIGGFDGKVATDSIEILKMTQHPLRWTTFGGKLPVKLSDHSSIIQQNKLYVIGGYNWNEQKASDEIHELSLLPPYTVKLLARMPQARRYHRAEIVNEKLFILGGTTTGQNKDALDSVVVYDFITKEFKTCPPLRKAVCDMSTVTWGSRIIVVGGADEHGQILNDVIMYDTETGRSVPLPSLKHKRSGSSAVSIDGVIVVFGGWNWEKKLLNSVESFTQGSDGWKELHDMKEERNRGDAVVLSHT